MTLRINLQETPLTSAGFSWFTDGSYLKDEHVEYHAVFAITTSLEVTETAPLPLATLAQQAELYTLTL